VHRWLKISHCWELNDSQLIPTSAASLSLWNELESTQDWQPAMLTEAGLLASFVIKDAQHIFLTPQMIYLPSVVVHTCSPSYSWGFGQRITWAQKFQTSLGNMARPISKGKKDIPKTNSRYLLTIGQCWSKPDQNKRKKQKKGWLLSCWVANEQACLFHRQGRHLSASSFLKLAPSVGAPLLVLFCFTLVLAWTPWACSFYAGVEVGEVLSWKVLHV
jgi:hypothetical protein